MALAAGPQLGHVCVAFRPVSAEATTMSADDEVEDDNRVQVDQGELLKSYVAFAVRAIRTRLKLVVLLFVAVAGACLGALAVWPRTYSCQSTLMAVPEGQMDPLRGAPEVITRHENLVTIVKKTQLAKSWKEERPPLLRLKDRLTGAHKVGDADLEAILVRSLQASLWVQRFEMNLVIGVDWPNPETAARLVDAAQKVFLQERHHAEIATIQERMAILDGHSTELRKEIEAIAEQLKGVREEKLAELGKASRVSVAPKPTAAPARPSAPASSAGRISPEEAQRINERIAEIKAEIEAKKRALADLKADRAARLSGAQMQLNELLERYTRAHPEVKRAERLVESFQGTSPQMATVESEIAALTEQLRAAEGQKPSAQPVKVAAGGAAAPSQPENEALPAEVLKLLETGTEVDPTITVQLQGAIGKYAALREEIRTSRIALDTAQASFNFRYKIVNPPEPPSAPSKPAIGKIRLIGLGAALLLALLVPIIAELRTGIMIERWQVHQMQLPILAELRLPPGPSEAAGPTREGKS